MQFWLVKSEPSVFSIDRLQVERATLWTGVRNYQARNFMQSMKIGDRVLYYHSNEDPIGVAGIARVSSLAVPDPTQFEPGGEYEDSKSTRSKPRWFCPEIRFVKKFTQVVPLQQLRLHGSLRAMVLLQKGSRLSVQPVKESEFMFISKIAE